MKIYVSVIIPVLNASSTIDELLESLLNQTYPKNRTEFIIVDNGSKDDTVERVQSYPVTLLFEHDKSGPYASRNRGFEHAGGTIFALTDANKIPDENWIEAGVNAIEGENADLVGGDIRFEIEDSPTTAEFYDSVTFNNNKILVQTEGGSAAGNLFFKRKVLDKIGPFPEEFRSGMDMWWTQQAVRNGFKLAYASGTVVNCKPRKLKNVLKKSYRVGVTHPHNIYESGKSVPYISAMIIRTFAPPRIKKIRDKMKESSVDVSIAKFWGVSWLSKICMGFGRLKGLAYIGRPKN